jgi:hypothetical protein
VTGVRGVAGPLLALGARGVQLVGRRRRQRSHADTAWFLSGAPDSRWSDEVLVDELRRVQGTDFEVVDVSALMISADSGQARP